MSGGGWLSPINLTTEYATVMKMIIKRRKRAENNSQIKINELAVKSTLEPKLKRQILNKVCNQISNNLH